MLNRKIKICFITAALEVGGAEKFFLDLLAHLDREKFEPFLATVVGGGKLEDKFKKLNLPTYIYGRHRIRYIGGFRQFWGLFFLFKKIKPDIVHTQLFPADLWGRLAATLARVPVIVTTEQNINVDQSPLREFLKKWTYKLADATVAISTAVKKYVMKNYGVPENKIVIIPNDVDAEKLERALAEAKNNLAIAAVAPTSAPNKKIILNVGRLVEQKGQKYLLAAFALLPQKNDCELWLAGEGVLHKELEEQTRLLGIEAQVKFLGVRHDIANLLARANVFAFPSLWEGLGIAILEAAIARVPIIASQIDGIVDIIKNNESGILAPAKDSHALALAMQYLLENTLEAEALAEQAHSWVKNNFDVKVVVRKYEELYLSFFK